MTQPKPDGEKLFNELVRAAAVAEGLTAQCEEVLSARCVLPGCVPSSKGWVAARSLRVWPDGNWGCVSCGERGRFDWTRKWEDLPMKMLNRVHPSTRSSEDDVRHALEEAPGFVDHVINVLEDLASSMVYTAPEIMHLRVKELSGYAAWLSGLRDDIRKAAKPRRDAARATVRGVRDQLAEGALRGAIQMVLDRPSDTPDLVLLGEIASLKSASLGESFDADESEDAPR